MADLHFTQDIAAPAKIVGAFFIPQRMGIWYGAELDLQFEVQGGAAEYRNGLKVRLTGRLGKREVGHTAVVTAYERARLLEWQFQDSYGVRGMQRWEIEATEQGCRVRLRDKYEMSGRIPRFLDKYFTRHAVAARDRKELARLKKAAEFAK